MKNLMKTSYRPRAAAPLRVALALSALACAPSWAQTSGHLSGLAAPVLGSMRMARDGFSYTDILHHYFANVHLVKLQNLDFFRDDGHHATVCHLSPRCAG